MMRMCYFDGVCRAVFGEKCAVATGKMLAKVGRTIVRLPQIFKRCICGAVWKLLIMASISAVVVILVVLYEKGFI